MRPLESLSLFLPGPWADQEDWSRHITIRGARGARGDLPFTLQRDLGRIDLEMEREEWVELCTLDAATGALSVICNCASASSTVDAVVHTCSAPPPSVEISSGLLRRRTIVSD